MCATTGVGPPTSCRPRLSEGGERVFSVHWLRRIKCRRLAGLSAGQTRAPALLRSAMRHRQVGVETPANSRPAELHVLGSAIRPASRAAGAAHLVP